MHSPTDGEASEARPKFALCSPQLSSPVDPGTYANSKYLLPHLGEKDPYFLSCTSFPVIENKTKAILSVVPLPAVTVTILPSQSASLIRQHVSVREQCGTPGKGGMFWPLPLICYVSLDKFFKNI